LLDSPLQRLANHLLTPLEKFIFPAKENPLKERTVSTKKKLLLSTLVILLVGGLWGYKKVKSMIRGGDIEDIAVFVPKDVSFFMANRGAGEQKFEFSRMGEIMENAGPRTQSYLNKVRELATPVLGFDPFVSANWQATGMSFYRPAGFAIAGDSMDNMHLLFFLPVGNESTLLETLDGVFTRAGGTVDIEQVEDHDLHVIQNLGGFFPLALNYAEHDDYVIGVFGMQGSFEPVATLDRIWTMEDGASLMDDKAFNNRLAATGSTWHSLSYTSAEAMDLILTGISELASVYGMDPGVLPTGGSAGMGTTHMTDDAFRYRGAQRMMPGLVEAAWFEGVTGKDKLGSKIPGKALLAMRGSIDVPALWEGAMAQDLGAQGFVTTMLADGLNLDIEKDIVQNIEGHFSTVVFEPDFQAMMPEFLTYAPVKNSAPLATLMDSGCRLLSLWGAQLDKDESGIWCTDGANTFMGIAHDHFLFGMSAKPKPYRKLDGEGYLNKLPKAAQTGLKSGPPGYLFLNATEIFNLGQAQKDTLESLIGEPIPLPPSLPIAGVSASVDLFASDPETPLEQGTTPYDARIEVQVLAAEGGIQEWLSQHLEETIVWAEGVAEDVTSSGVEAPAVAGVQATLKEISDWQIMGAEELGEPYAACGSEEKAQALVNGGDPNTVYTHEDRTCFENIGWSPAAGSVAFWTVTQGPSGAPTGFTVYGMENGGNTSSLQHPANGQ